MAIHLPPLRFDYLKAITDDTGILQHAKYSIPKRSEGYTTDDNARALIAAIKYYQLKKDAQMKDMANTYLAFINYMQKPDGNFHNYLSYGRAFMDVDGSEECVGRTLWACGCTINSGLPRDTRLAAKEIFDKGLPWVWKSISLRFYASAILGLKEYYQTLPENNLKNDIEKLADSFVKSFNDETKDNWQWFEPFLTYDNGRLPQALFAAYSIVKKPEYLQTAKKSMNFLLETQIIDGIYMPIGNDGWYKRGENRAFYDQQPLEATAMVEAAIDAYCATKEKQYFKAAKAAFGWFLGQNSRGVMIYNPETAGCYDGLSTEEVNRNQGAESSICYLLARIKLEEANQCFRAPKENLT